MRVIGLCAAGFLIGFVSHAQADGLPVTLVSITRPVHPGGTVTLVVQTAPRAICRGSRQGHFSDDYAIALPPQTIGADGRGQWQWSVRPGNHPIGLRGVRVTCAVNGQSGLLTTQFDVE